MPKTPNDDATYTATHVGGDRYAYDTGACSPANGYAQIDTSEDAPYYGAWINPTTRTLVVFMEGDLCVTECETDAILFSVVEAMASNCDRFGIDPMGRQNITDGLVSAGLGRFIH